MTGKIIRSSFSLALLVLLAGACLFSGILYSYYEKQSFASLSQEALQIRQTLEYIAPDQIRSSDRVTLIASDGTVLYDSVAKATDMDNHLSREEVACALQEGTGTSSHYIASEPGAEQFGRHAAEHGVAHSGHRGRAFIAGGCAVGAVGQADHKAHQCHFTR